MKKILTKLEGVFVLEPIIHGDYRGWFSESYSKKVLLSLGIDIDFVQDNHSYTKNKDTFRGIHFQNYPFSQTKLVRCTKGKVLDYIVDLRKNSSTYKEWISIELSDENKKQVLIPKGCGHAFLTLTDDCEFQYKCDEYYHVDSDAGIKYNDPEIGLTIPSDELILSEKDLSLPLLINSNFNF